MPKLYFADEAERFAHRIWDALKLELPVDINKVAEKLGIDIYYEPFIEQIDGFYLLIPDAPPVIAVNNHYIKPLGRQRFTAAHEIAHHLFRSRVSPNQPKLFFVDGTDTRKTILERACDRFAALLLMPESLVRLHFNELSTNPDKRLSILANRFGVSMAAMRARLRELQLPYQMYHNRTRRY